MKGSPLNYTDTQEQSGPWDKSVALAVFFVILAAELLAAYVLVYQKGYIMIDALSRTANAYYVFHISPHKLASIGFVWNPLPSLLQLPLLQFSGVWRPLATHGLAGCIVTAFFAAFNAAYLFRCAKRYALKTSAALTLTALYAFNPFIFYYGCNGMSETPLFTSLIVSVACLSRWMEERRSTDLMLIAVMLALGFLCRYEAVPFAAGIALALAVIVFFLPDLRSPFVKKSWSMKFHYYVATGVVVFLPVAYTVLVWILLNWTIMGDPLYFQHSIYSNAAQTSYIQSIGILNALIKMLPFALLFLAIGLQRLIQRRLLKGDFLVLTLIVGVITVFHFAMLLAGKSYGWLRFFCFALPICAAWLPYELSQLKDLFRKAVFVLCAGSMLASGVMVGTYLTKEDRALEEYGAFIQTDTSMVAMQIRAAGRINESYADGVMILDSSQASGLILNLEHPENLIINSSLGFDVIIEKPWAYGVRYVLVANPPKVGLGSLDAFNIAYPDLYEHGADWCVEREDLGSYKIFEVIY